MSDKLKESVKREITLEAIIQAMWEVYNLSRDQIPVTTNKLDYLDNVMDGLFNEAGVRENIGDICKMSIEFEDSNE